jgi:hypothetical protein
MAVPSSNISMSAIYGEANAGGPPSDLAVSDLFKKSYFESNAFGGPLSYNAWGQYGNASGADRIYGLSASNTNNNFNQFASKVYYIDNSTYANYIDVVNNLVAPPPPNPPDLNDVTVFCKLYDSTGAYQYSFFQSLIAAGGSASQIFSNTTEPILAVAYWEVQFQPSSPMFAGTTCNIDINNTSKVSGGTINAAGITTFSFSTLGSELVASNSSGYIGTYFDISIG